jgi:hypothetical protein
MLPAYEAQLPQEIQAMLSVIRGSTRDPVGSGDRVRHPRRCGAFGVLLARGESLFHTLVRLGNAAPPPRVEIGTTCVTATPCIPTSKRRPPAGWWDTLRY